MRCWYTRWQLSSALDRGDLPARLQRGHAARCSSCQAFARSLIALDARLAREADVAEAPVVAERRVRWTWLVGGPLAAGAAAVIALAIGLRRDPPPPPAPAPLALQASEPIAVRGLADQVVKAFASSPLETELDDLLHDGRRGLDAILATGGLKD